MTPVLLLGHAFLALAALSCAGLQAGSRERVIRWVAGTGVVLALALVVARGSLDPWRSGELSDPNAVLLGAAVACSWGLSLALDLGPARWWVASLVGVASTGSLLFGAAEWSVPALLFWGTSSAAISLAAARAGIGSWLVLGAADAAFVGALVAFVVAEEAWRLPEVVGFPLVVPLALGVLLRSGAVPRLGLGALVGTRAAPLVPLVSATAFAVLFKMMERPIPLAAATSVLVALAIVTWSLLHRKLEPSVLVGWPVALGFGLSLTAQGAAAPAGVAAVLGVTVVTLWPDALERGRLSRAFLLSAAIPNVVFGAVAIAAAESFRHIQTNDDPVDAVGWILTSGLLPVALASGVALGALAARSGSTRGYHPEAAFMTWLLAGGSVGAGLLLGSTRPYETLGGSSAAVLVGMALAVGLLAAWRTAGEGGTRLDSSAVVIRDAPSFPRSAAYGAALLQVVAAAAIAWVTVTGLQTGFL
jgi:hypothetical protein